MSSRIHLTLFVGAALAALGGCSDSGSTPPTPTDAATDAAHDASPTDVPNVTDAGTDVPVTDAGDGGTDGGTTCAPTRALVATSNYAMGGWALGPVATPTALAALAGTAADQDHGPVQSGCLVFDLQRGNDAVDVLDPAHLPMVAHHIPLRPAGVDAGMGYLSNPQDAITLGATRVYVAQLASPRIAILDPTRDGMAAVTGSVDLSPVRSPLDTDPSGSPEPVAFARSGARVYVALENLSSFAPVTNGTLAVIDPATDTLVDTDPTTPGVQPIALSNRNPIAMVPAGDGRVAVSEAGVVAFMPPQVLDGVIEAVDLVAGHPVTAQRVTEMQLGGDVSGIVMFDATHGWVVVSVLGTDGGTGENRVVPFDLGAATVGAAVLHTGSIGGIGLAPDGTVWVLDRSTGHSGVRVFRHDTGAEVTTAAVSTGPYPPYGLAFVP